MSKRIIIESKDPLKSANKVVTIREVDRDLFEQFTSLTKTWRKNVGEIFSRVLENYLEIGSTNIFMPSFEERLKKMGCSYLEIIENLKELAIHKRDLTSLPKGVKLYFYNIKKLIFSEEINTSTLLDYVFRINNSVVIPPKNILKLPYLSLLQNSSEYLGKKREFKYCQLNNNKTSIVINRILWEVIPEMEITQIMISKIKESIEDVFLISSHESITISQNDLQKIGDKKVLFHRIKELTFKEDISQETFLEKVLGIYNCVNVNFPNDFSKLLQLSRVKEYPSK
ncbi:MAG: hypothetical protein ACTSSB_05315 [Candidatus Heimdallarchaeota archaeon]